MSAASRWLARVGFSQAATESPAFGDWATRLSSQRSASSWRAIKPGASAQALRRSAVLGFVGSDLVGLALVFQAVRFGEGFEAGQFERRVGDAGGVNAHQVRGAEPVFALRRGGELVADPGDGGAHGALVGGLAFDAEVALPAFAGIEALERPSA